MARSLTDTYATQADAVVLSSDSVVEGFLYVGVSGDVKVDMVSGDTVTYKALAAGVVHPIYVKKVYSTTNGTSATDILIVR